MSNKQNQIRKMKRIKSRKKSKKFKKTKNERRIQVNEEFAKAYSSSISTLRNMQMEIKKIEGAMNNLIIGATINVPDNREILRHGLSEDGTELILIYKKPEFKKPEIAEEEE